jgi:hypothetical protein
VKGESVYSNQRGFGKRETSQTQGISIPEREVMTDVPGRERLTDRRKRVLMAQAQDWTGTAPNHKWKVSM